MGWRGSLPPAGGIGEPSEYLSTAWDGIPLLREEDDWIIELPVERGVQRFGFLVDDEWYVPSDAPGRGRDEWGGEQATLIVPGEQEPPM